MSKDPKYKIHPVIKKKDEELKPTAKENPKITFGEGSPKKGQGRKGAINGPKQRKAASTAMTQYHQDVREGKIVKNPWATHGAFRFMKTGKVPKEKKHLIKFVTEERQKWVEQMGGEDNLSYMDESLLDVASRMLLSQIMVDEYIMKNNEEMLYKEEGSGEIKMHTALSRNYLSFSKTYISILKEMNKTSGAGKKTSSKKSSDSAARIQKLMAEQFSDDEED